MSTESLAHKPKQGYGGASGDGAVLPIRATAPDFDVCTVSGSVALLPMSKSAKSYCAHALAGWSVAGIFFIPRANSDHVLRILTKRFSCRVDGEIVS